MAFRYKGVRQCFRWIEAGRFNMGSHPGESERNYNEKQHEVIFSNGFWMAETTVTQELWEAVTGDNPSGFKGKNNPVENVSWEDCAGFMEKLNGLMPELDLRLPTEAEWEYACRAKTTGPFYFGDNINTDQVNFDGNNPYSDGKKGEYRQTTVPVGSLPCNNFGLYEMHGNVWEWCSDWYGAYPDASVTDPVGPDTGESVSCAAVAGSATASTCAPHIATGTSRPAAAVTPAFVLPEVKEPGQRNCQSRSRAEPENRLAIQSDIENLSNRCVLQSRNGPQQRDPLLRGNNMKMKKAYRITKGDESCSISIFLYQLENESLNCCSISFDM